MATVPTSQSPYSELPAVNVALFEAKARKGLSFDDIAKAVGRDEVWLAAAFYGQVREIIAILCVIFTLTDNYCTGQVLP
jgi:hypothetical protein